MKKLIYFIIFIIILIICYFVFLNNPKSYEITYTFNDYNVKEKYNKDNGMYYYTLTKDGVDYNYSFYGKYSNKRKLIKNIISEDYNDYKCVSMETNSNTLPYLCYLDGNYYSGYYVGISNNTSNELINTVNNISIYNNSYSYYIWNGYGFTDVINNKEYNFLSNESYDNTLSYQFNEYIIIADYDSSRTFNKFYLFNTDSKKISTMDLDVDINFSSYFLGSVDNYIYLFDKKEKKEYKINIDKKSIEVISDDEGARLYQNGWEDIGINKLVYNEYAFINENVVYYNFIDNKLYYNYDNTDINILIDDDENINIVNIIGNDIYYLKNDELYHFNYSNGLELLLSYFEWNFSYDNKIFIFD